MNDDIIGNNYLRDTTFFSKKIHTSTHILTSTGPITTKKNNNFGEEFCEQIGVHRIFPLGKTLDFKAKNDQDMSLAINRSQAGEASC